MQKSFANIFSILLTIENFWHFFNICQFLSYSKRRAASCQLLEIKQLKLSNSPIYFLLFLNLMLSTYFIRTLKYQKTLNFKKIKKQKLEN